MSLIMVNDSSMGDRAMNILATSTMKNGRVIRRSGEPVWNPTAREHELHIKIGNGKTIVIREPELREWVRTVELAKRREKAARKKRSFDRLTECGFRLLPPPVVKAQ